MSSASLRSDIARLAVQESAFRERVRTLSCTSPEEARLLALFAHRCVVGTPLAGGLTPLELLNDTTAVLAGIRLAGHWLGGEAITADQLEQAWAEARREASTMANDMVGATAAQWAAIAAIQVVRCAISAAAGSPRYAEGLEAVGFAALYGRAAGGRPSWNALLFQISVADELFPPNT